MKRRRVWWWVGSVVGVLGLGIAGLVAYLTMRSTASAATSGGVAKVTRENLDVIVRSQGLIVAATTIEVKSRASGYVQAVHATAGDRVKRDQILLEVDPARSRLDEEEMRNEVEVAKSQVKLSEESRDPERLTLLQKRLERQRDLFEKGLSKREDVDNAEYELASAGRALRSQEKQLEAARVRLETALTRLRRAQTESAFTTIRAPIDGVILSRAVEVGSGVTSFSDSAQGGSVLFKIGSLDRLAFEGSLAVSDLTRVKPALPARVSSDAWPAPASGTVTYVGQEAIAQQQANSSQANRAPTFQVKVQLDASAAKDLPLNVPAIADIVVSTVPDALVVPFSCVRHLPNAQGSIRELSGGTARERVVKLGPVSAGKVQIIGDVAEGASITGCGTLPNAVRP